MNHELYQQFERYARIFLQHKRVVVVVALLVMTLGVVISYVLPKKYEAQSTVFIEQSVISELVKGIATTPSMEAKIKVLGVAMLSRETLLKVMRIMDKDVEFSSDMEREAYITDLRKRISIRLDEKRGIFFISFLDSDPRYARDFVNTITQVYIESNTASKRDESLEATRFLSDQIESFKKRLDAVEEEINQYKAEHGLQLATDETTIRFEIADAERKLEAIRARRLELETRLQLMPSGSGRSTHLTDMERQLAALMTAYTDQHPKVVRLQGQISAVKSSPAGGMTGNSGGAAKTLIQAEIDAATLQETAGLATIDEKTALLRRIPALRTGLNELLRKKENETLIYSQLVTRYGQSEVSKQMEMENKSMNFRVVDPAVMPDTAVSPKRVPIMLLSALAGIGIGIAVIMVPYIMRGSVESLSDLRTLNQRVLAVLPAIPKPKEERLRVRGDRIFLSGAALYFLLLVTVVIMEALGQSPIDAMITRALGPWL
ncbi:MAG: polysaccharide chain length determinant protein [Desulfomicrobium sp.]|nr:polysaccharide chain length determinant protein [Pseudomonadota bacterium]MBV1711391.1 polysaccharide chain length determinant protein [Desulfomicrobium sp.]MBU4570793.1 polysaccharide chain length determinant protein [Pseudomonadota bacterium]MBU4595282.1 polysaccharide chain length determinant protein [Pseudomonadota bacterium]MBV1720715.1 polysaccharide chain length determinant protein [Desulfomicrobium sp.]